MFNANVLLMLRQANYVFGRTVDIDFNWSVIDIVLRVNIFV